MFDKGDKGRIALRQWCVDASIRCGGGGLHDIVPLATAIFGFITATRSDVDDTPGVTTGLPVTDQTFPSHGVIASKVPDDPIVSVSSSMSCAPSEAAPHGILPVSADWEDALSYFDQGKRVGAVERFKRFNDACAKAVEKGQIRGKWPITLVCGSEYEATEPPPPPARERAENSPPAPRRRLAEKQCEVLQAVIDLYEEGCFSRLTDVATRLNYGTGRVAFPLGKLCENGYAEKILDVAHPELGRVTVFRPLKNPDGTPYHKPEQK